MQDRVIPMQDPTFLKHAFRLVGCNGLAVLKSILTHPVGICMNMIAMKVMTASYFTLSGVTTRRSCVAMAVRCRHSNLHRGSIRICWFDFVSCQPASKKYPAHNHCGM